MACMLDSNMMLRWANRLDINRPLALAAIKKLRKQGVVLHSTPQNYIEFWNIATRPVEANGLGAAPATAYRLVRRLRPLFPLLPDTPAVFDEWIKLVVATGVSGKQVHDARLAAVMQTHGVTHILTFNVADFKRFEPLGITVAHPAAV